ncbi:MAG: signal peptidase I [Desulfurococcaceae archaeon]
MQARFAGFKSFFVKSLYLVSSIFFLLSMLVIVFTLLSRLGYLNIMGMSVVISDSMEPVVRIGDMVIYLNMDFNVGDVVVYCVTPSHCVVHRVVGFLHLNTVSGDKTMVVTKGDNVDMPDSPISMDMVKGKVVFIIPRELWIPLIIAVIAYTLRDFIKTPVIGSLYIVVLCVWILLVTSVYAVVPRTVMPSQLIVRVVNLAGVYMDYTTCTVSIKYTGALSLTSARVVVNSTPVEIISVLDKTVIVKPDHELLRRAFENGVPLEIWVEGEFNNVAWLSGRYELLVGGLSPELSVVNGVLIAKNPNCFPVVIDIAMRYLVNNTWAWSNKTVIVKGFSYVVIEPPVQAEYAYAYVYWFNQGDRRWVGLQVKTG